MVMWAGLQAKLDGGFEMGRLWNRLVNMENDCLTKTQFYVG